MNEIVWLLLSLSVSGSILAIIIFAIKPFIRHKLPKSIQYCIWIVVLLRLILPISFDESIMNQVFYGDQATLITSPQGEENPNTSFIWPHVQENVSNGTYNNDTDHSRYFSDLFNQYLFYIWLLGVIIVLAFNLIGYARFVKNINQTNRPASAEESQMLTDLLNGRENVQLLRNRYAATPMLIGILKPLIIIPDIHFSEKQLKNILLHEVMHYRRFDIGIKWLTMIAASLHWFNPLMCFIKREIDHACELSCDEAVIRNLDADEKQAYGDTLISVVADHKYPPGALQATMSEEKATLKERLVAIMKYSKKAKSNMLISIALLISFISGAVILGGCVDITNPNSNEKPASDNVTTNVTTMVYDARIKNKLVVIDPAHGGDDFGGTYPFDVTDNSLVEVKEKDLNLKISLKLYEMLKTSGIPVEITRKDDRGLSLDERISMANEKNAALFLNIHTGMANDESVNGTSTTFCSDKNRQTAGLTSERFAGLLQNELHKQLQTTDLGVKEGNFKVLTETNASSAIVDVAFISNESDRKNLMDEAFRDRAALALYDGVIASLHEMVSAEP